MALCHFDSLQQQQHILPGAQFVLFIHLLFYSLLTKLELYLFGRLLFVYMLLLLALFKLETLIIMAMSKLNSRDLPKLAF